MNRKFFAIAAVAIVGIVMSKAQSPAPIVVQAMSPVTAVSAPKAVTQDASSSSSQETVKMLEQIKAANQETLKRQQATLDQLEEAQKAAEQLKVFTKRG